MMMVIPLELQWTRILVFVSSIIHFSIVASTNLRHMHQHVPEAQGLAQLHVMFDKLEKAVHMQHYAAWSGIHGGYGFYSPSVGNSYQIQFHCQFQKVNTYYHSPGIKSEPGRIRYQSFLDIGAVFLEKGQEEAKESVRVAIQLATEEFSLQYPSDSIVSILMTKLTPTLEALRSDHLQETVYVSLYQYADTNSPQPL
nr:hypothetical protein [uncultured Sphingobacterium sp.]